jgi:hypothetical protein
MCDKSARWERGLAFSPQLRIGIVGLPLPGRSVPQKLLGRDEPTDEQREVEACSSTEEHLLWTPAQRARFQLIGEKTGLSLMRRVDPGGALTDERPSSG